MKKQIDLETLEIIASFIAEGHERLDDAEVQLEGASTEDVDCLNSVFRLFHSVKGSAGYLGFENIKRLTHEAEALLEIFLKEKAPVTPDALDVVYQTIDALRSMINLVERENSDEDAASLAADRVGVIKDLIPRLRALVTVSVEKTKEDTSALPAETPRLDQGSKEGDVEGLASFPAHKAPAGDAAPGPDVRSAPEGTTTSAESGSAAQNVIVLNELVTADMVARFLGECADLMDEVEQRSMALSQAQDSKEAVNELFRSIHTIKGNAGFFGHSLLERLCMDLEGLLDRARRGESQANEGFVNLLISRIDAIRAAIVGVRIVDPSIKASSEAVAAQTIQAPQNPIREEKGGANVESYKPLGEILVDMGAIGTDDLRQALEVQDRPIGEILVESGATKPEEVAQALVIQRAGASGAEGAKPAEHNPVEDIQRKEIRVDTAKLDKLFELVGELITAETMVGNSPDLSGLKLDHFQKSFAGLNKISREIQETAMMIRMIPLESLFHKMTRLVRDLSRKFGKPVDFLVTGQDTEMDKNVIDQISDPLVHILRNAIDHGLERPETRVAAGKSAAGQVKLHARYEGSEIWISVSDDGNGLDRERILAKAVERGMISGDPASLDDSEVWPFIFEPGFSTAEKVSEVSGRGVGMDVVKKNLERIRGRVDISTEKGKGTDFVLKIPLTMAIIEGITVRSGHNFYSLPLGDILEFFKAAPAQITEAEGGEETVDLRGTVLPLLKLGEIFSVKGAILDPLEGILIVVQSAGLKACLLIDEVVGNQQIVVKSLSEYLGKVDGISGCSILGDGSVSFIIDTGRLIALRVE